MLRDSSSKEMTFSERVDSKSMFSSLRYGLTEADLRQSLREIRKGNVHRTLFERLHLLFNFDRQSELTLVCVFGVEYKGEGAAA